MTSRFDNAREVGVQPQPQIGALFGMELRRDHVLARDDAGEIDAVFGRAQRHLTLGRVDIIRVHEVEVAGIGDAVEQRMLDGIPNASYFYFVHSYYVDPAEREMTLGATEYGIDFASVVARENVVATQFHPEKSADLGLRLYANFARIVETACHPERSEGSAGRYARASGFFGSASE